jgi:photosystem II stability/assembly factor-like uncharacterized protein
MKLSRLLFILGLLAVLTGCASTPRMADVRTFAAESPKLAPTTN